MKVLKMCSARQSVVYKIPYRRARAWPSVQPLGRALFYKPIWELTVNERRHYADSEDTFFLKLKLVLPNPWTIKVSKNRINCTSLSVAARIM